MSKGSAYVLPFFVPPPPKGGFLLQCRPVWYCQRARFVFPLGPNELPSVALWRCDEAPLTIFPLLFCFSCIAFSFAAKNGRKEQVMYFQNLTIQPTILSFPVIIQGCADSRTELGVLGDTEMNAIKLFHGGIHLPALRQECQIAYHHKVFDATAQTA